jgi:hypothetical protein
MWRDARIERLRHRSDLDKLENATAISDIGHDDIDAAGLEQVAETAAGVNAFAGGDRDIPASLQVPQALQVESVQRLFNPDKVEIFTNIHEADQLVVIETAREIEHQPGVGTNHLAQCLDPIDRALNSEAGQLVVPDQVILLLGFSLPSYII